MLICLPRWVPRYCYYTDLCICHHLEVFVENFWIFRAVWTQLRVIICTNIFRWDMRSCGVLFVIVFIPRWYVFVIPMPPLSVKFRGAVPCIVEYVHIVIYIFIIIFVI